MQDYQNKAIVDALESIVGSLANLADRMEEISETLTSIDNALRVQDTDGKGLADSIDEMRARLEDGISVVAGQDGTWAVDTSGVV